MSTSNIENNLDILNILYNQKTMIKNTLNNYSINKNNNLAGNFHLAPGINNFGNTCFHNATIQLLYRIEELTDFLMYDNVFNQFKDNTNIKRYVSLIRNMHQSNTIINDKNLVMSTCNISFRNFQFTQEDAQELLNSILDKLSLTPGKCTDVTIDYKINKQVICDKNKNLIKTFPNTDPRNFIIFKKSDLQCNTGINGVDTSYFKDNIAKNKFGLRTQLLIEYNKCIQNNKFSKLYTRDENMLQLNIINQNKTNVEDIISDIQFQSFDNIIKQQKYIIKKDNMGNDKIYFEKNIIKFNKYLICHLLIFDFQNNGIKVKSNLQLAKNNGFITINENNNKIEYELVAIVVHSGQNIQSGHYLAYIKHNTGWYHYDDTVRTQINTNSDYNSMVQYMKSKNEDPYIVLYRQKSKYKFNIYNPNSIPQDMNNYLVPVIQGGGGYDGKTYGLYLFPEKFPSCQSISKGINWGNPHITIAGFTADNKYKIMDALDYVKNYAPKNKRWKLMPRKIKITKGGKQYDIINSSTLNKFHDFLIGRVDDLRSNYHIFCNDIIGYNTDFLRDVKWNLVMIERDGINIKWLRDTIIPFYDF